MPLLQKEGWTLHAPSPHSGAETPSGQTGLFFGPSACRLQAWPDTGTGGDLSSVSAQSTQDSFSACTTYHYRKKILPQKVSSGFAEVNSVSKLVIILYRVVV